MKLDCETKVKKETVTLLDSVLTSFVERDAVSKDEKFEIMKRVKLKFPLPPQKELRPELITRKAASESFKLSLRSVDRLREAGLLTPIKVGKRALRFKRSQIEEIIESGIEFSESDAKAIPAEVVKPGKEKSANG